MYDPSFWLWYYHETNRVCADEQETSERITVSGLAKIKKLCSRLLSVTKSKSQENKNEFRIIH